MSALSGASATALCCNSTARLTSPLSSSSSVNVSRIPALSGASSFAFSAYSRAFGSFNWRETQARLLSATASFGVDCSNRLVEAGCGGEILLRLRRFRQIAQEGSITRVLLEPGCSDLVCLGVVVGGAQRLGQPDREIGGADKLQPVAILGDRIAPGSLLGVDVALQDVPHRFLRVLGLDVARYRKRGRHCARIELERDQPALRLEQIRLERPMPCAGFLARRRCPWPRTEARQDPSTASVSRAAIVKAACKSPWHCCCRPRSLARVPKPRRSRCGRVSRTALAGLRPRHSSDRLRSSNVRRGPTAARGPWGLPRSPCRSSPRPLGSYLRFSRANPPLRGAHLHYSDLWQ